MPTLTKADHDALTAKLLKADPADFDTVTDSFLEELGRRTNGLAVPTTQASPLPTAPKAPAAPAPPPTAAPTTHTGPLAPDVSFLARTAFGEGEGEGLEGQRAIMHVIKNRMGKRWPTVEQVVHAPSQFESWAADNPRKPVMEGLDLSDPKMAELVQMAQAVLAGTDKDITGKSTLFYNPKKADPGWAKKAKPTIKLGDHQFMSE